MIAADCQLNQRKTPFTTLPTFRCCQSQRRLQGRIFGTIARVTAFLAVDASSHVTVSTTSAVAGHVLTWRNKLAASPPAAVYPVHGCPFDGGFVERIEFLLRQVRLNKRDIEFLTTATRRIERLLASRVNEQSLQAVHAVDVLAHLERLVCREVVITSLARLVLDWRRLQ
jgi:hypothetical protein